MRLKTPLQYACSLGLFQIVARLLKEGSNPNLLDDWDGRDKINDYYELPLDIVMNPKHHDIGLAVEGLSYVVKYDRAT